MLFYFSVWFCLFVCSFLELKNLRKIDAKFLFFILVSFLFVLSVIRWETGTDWDTYYAYFLNVFEFNQDTEFEYAFARLNEIVKLYFDNYTLLLFIFAIIIFVSQTKAIIVLSPYPIFTLFFLWSISLANVFFIRQSIATAILAYSVIYLVEKKTKMFFMLVGVAFLFHRSSILFLFSYWIYKIRLTNLKICFVILISLLATIVLSSILNSILPFMGDIIRHKMEVYLDLGENDQSISSSSLQAIMIRGFANKILILIFLMYYSSKSNLNLNPRFYGLLSLYVFGVFVYFTTLPISVVLIRFSFAFDIIQIFLLPMVMNNIPYKSRLLWFVFWSVFFMARFYVSIYGNYYDLYIPYKTIFSS